MNGPALIAMVAMLHSKQGRQCCARMRRGQLLFLEGGWLGREAS